MNRNINIAVTIAGLMKRGMHEYDATRQTLESRSVSKAQVVAEAESRELKVNPKDTKADLVSKILRQLAAQEAADAADEDAEEQEDSYVMDPDHNCVHPPLDDDETVAEPSGDMALPAEQARAGDLYYGTALDEVMVATKWVYFRAGKDWFLQVHKGTTVGIKRPATITS